MNKNFVIEGQEQLKRLSKRRTASSSDLPEAGQPDSNSISFVNITFKVDTNHTKNNENNNNHNSSSISSIQQMSGVKFENLE